MSNLGASRPDCTGAAGSVELRIDPRERDLGGFTVRRVLPAADRRSVGPFVFFDHMGPANLRRVKASRCVPIRTSAWPL